MTTRTRTLATAAFAGLLAIACTDDPTAPRLLAARPAFSAQPTATIVAGQTIAPVTITLMTADGQVAIDSTYKVSLSLSSTDGAAQLSGTTTSQTVRGIATFSDLSIARAGTEYRLVAKVAGLDSMVSGAFAITPGPAAQMRFELIPGKLNNFPVGEDLPLIVRLTDGAGNTVTSGTNAVTVSYTRTGDFGFTLAPDDLLGPATATPVAGVASLAGRTVHKSGIYVLSATSPGLAPATSISLMAMGAGMSQLAFITQPQSAAAGAPLPAFSVISLDPYGNAVSLPPGPSYTVTLSLGANPSGATLGGTLSRTVAGTTAAAFDNVTIDKRGTGYTIVATYTAPFSSTPSFSRTSATFDIQ